jgi:hypothetical protein
MGCCFSKRNNDDGDIEINLSTTNQALTCKIGLHGEKITVTPGNDVYEIQGTGIVLGSCPLDCDTARWEVIVGSLSSDNGIQIGVKRSQKKAPTNLNGQLSESVLDPESPSWLLQGVKLKEGDVVGVYWDQTDLPMLSFTVNGSVVSHASINRIRPSSEIFPAVSITNSSCSFVLDEKGFKYPSLSSKFKMIICSASII